MFTGNMIQPFLKKDSETRTKYPEEFMNRETFEYHCYYVNLLND